MRIYEPLRLKRHHFRADDNTLYVEKTKFKKDRLIPIPRAVAVEITNYLAVRQSLWGADDNPYLLAASPKKPFYDYLIRPRFHQAVGDIGLSCPRQTIGTTNIGCTHPSQPQAQLCGQHLKTHHRNRPIPAARPAGAGRLPGPLRIQTHDQISEAPGRQPPA